MKHKLSANQRAGLLRLLEYQQRLARAHRQSDYLPWGGARQHQVLGSMQTALERRGLVESKLVRDYHRRMICRLTTEGLACARHLAGRAQAAGGAV